MKIVRKESTKFIKTINTVTFGTAFKLFAIPDYWKPYTSATALRRVWFLADGYYKGDRDKGLLIVDLENGQVRALKINTEVRILPNTTITIGEDS